MKYLHLIESGGFHKELVMGLRFLHILNLHWRVLFIFKVLVFIIMYLPSYLYSICISCYGFSRFWISIFNHFCEKHMLMFEISEMRVCHTVTNI